MAIPLLAPDPDPVAHVITSGPFDGVTLFARRPRYADQLAWVMARTPGERLAERLKLVTGWKGAGADPSPFTDPTGEPLAFSDARFATACEVHPLLINDAM